MSQMTLSLKRYLKLFNGFVFSSYLLSFKVFTRRRSSFLCCRLFLKNRIVNNVLKTDSQLSKITTPSVYFSKEICVSSSIYSKMSFNEEKEKYLHMSLKEKRKQYRCEEKYISLEDIPPWTKYLGNVKKSDSAAGGSYSKSSELNNKISIFVGDITALEVDSIVNAGNKTLRGGGGVDGAIHRAAGPMLLQECITLNGCDTGEAKITGGYKLPAKYVIHTVGPFGEKPELLINCYSNSLKVLKENGLRSIAFPCISTGVYRYPNEDAAHVALKTVRDFLEKNGDSVDRVIFCLFLRIDVEIYENLAQVYFPV